ncbi:hypothetical protein ACHHYP_15836 [Achlya hypogyna]|uniref:Uncharacterized protein n=1 Tax=Achlya hypogyna TaxID=1202772 RepID=A0A1V9ZEI7_ACHHY|nr:hypothetical protein ACHHYP_15836 [Achlya hypogyna]
MAAATLAEHLRLVTDKVLSTVDLPEPPVPEPPKWKSKSSIKAKLHAIQAYLSALEYNYTGRLYFNVNKNRSYKSIYGTAKEIISEALPIQCLEAVFVAAYLTAHGMPEYEGLNPSQQIDRVPISFKSRSGDSTFRHIVLGVRHQHVWGALGLSRSPALMNKDLKYKSFSDLVADYIENFVKCQHQVTKVYVGFPFSHDIHSSEKVQWRVLNIKIVEHPWEAVAAQIDLFTRESSELMSHLHRVGELPDSFRDKFPFHKPPKRPHGSVGGNHPRTRSESETLGAPDDHEVVPLEEPAPVIVDTRRLLLRPAPEMVRFQRQPSATPSAFVEFKPVNMYLHNESAYPLQVDVVPPKYLLVVGKPLVKVDEASGAKLDQPYCRFLLQPRSIVSMGLRFALPSTADSTGKRDTLALEYVALDATARAPVVDDESTRNCRLVSRIEVPFEWE